MAISERLSGNKTGHTPHMYKIRLELSIQSNKYCKSHLMWQAKYFHKYTYRIEIHFLLIHKIHAQCRIANDQCEHYQCIDCSETFPFEWQLGCTATFHTNHWHYREKLSQRQHWTGGFLETSIIKEITSRCTFQALDVTCKLTRNLLISYNKSLFTLTQKPNTPWNFDFNRAFIECSFVQISRVSVAL